MKDSDGNVAQAVADVASRLFGTHVGPEWVIDESLDRATDDDLKLDDVRPKLAAVLTSPVPDVLTDEALRRHPLAVWTELAIGLEDAQELKRKKPIPFEEAVTLLSKDSGVDPKTCRSRLETFLTRVSLPEKARGGSGDGAFLARHLRIRTGMRRAILPPPAAAIAITSSQVKRQAILKNGLKSAMALCGFDRTERGERPKG